MRLIAFLEGLYETPGLKSGEARLAHRRQSWSAYVESLWGDGSDRTSASHRLRGLLLNFALHKMSLGSTALALGAPRVTVVRALAGNDEKSLVAAARRPLPLLNRSGLQGLSGAGRRKRARLLLAPSPLHLVRASMSGPIGCLAIADFREGDVPVLQRAARALTPDSTLLVDTAASLLPQARAEIARLVGGSELVERRFGWEPDRVWLLHDG